MVLHSPANSTGITMAGGFWSGATGVEETVRSPTGRVISRKSVAATGGAYTFKPSIPAVPGETVAAVHAAVNARTYHAALHPPSSVGGTQLGAGQQDHRRQLRASKGTSPRPQPGNVDVAGTATGVIPTSNATMGWPMRGYDNAHSGRSPFTGPVSCPELRWQQRFGTGNKTFLWTESSPAVDSSGRVFVGSGTKLWALELATGSVIWQYDVADKKHLKVRVFALRLWWRGQGGKGARGNH